MDEIPIIVSFLFALVTKNQESEISAKNIPKEGNKKSIKYSAPREQFSNFLHPPISWCTRLFQR